MRGTDGFVGRFVSLFGSKAVSTIIAIASTPIIVRLLDPEGYGNYAVMLSIFSLYMIPISASVTEGVQKFVSEVRDDDWREQVIRFYLLLALGLVLVGSAILLVFTWLGYAERIFGSGFTEYFYLLVGFVFVSQFRAISVHTVLGFGLEHISGPMNVLKKVVTVGVGVALVWRGFGVNGMLIGHIAAGTAVVLVGGYVIGRRVSLRSVLSAPDSLPRREFLSFNALNVVLVLLVMSLFHVDVVIVQTLVGSESTGYYKAALALAEYLWIVPIVLQSLLLHSSSTLWSDNRLSTVTELAGRITRYTTLLVLLMAVGLATLADSLVPLYYGEQYAVAVTPLLLLLPGAVGFAVARPLQAICQGSGELRTLILAVGVAAGINLGLNALLIPRFGMNGAAVATSVGYGSMFLLLVWASRTIGYDPLVDFRPVRIAITALGSGALIVGLDYLVGNDIVSLVVVPVFGAAVFFGVAIAIGALDIDELREILGKLPLPFGLGGRIGT
jgi:O-antigen/teichoic acid export membrane protein